MRDWSSIPKQKLLVENGEHGDCWRCCIAAILGIPADVVPNFIEDEKGKLNPHMDHDTQLWLNDRGYAMICVMGERNIIYPRWHKKGVDLPLISCGPTERSKGLGKHHAVVTIWDQLVYDPHPSEAGLTAITEQWLIFRPLK